MQNLRQGEWKSREWGEEFYQDFSTLVHTNYGDVAAQCRSFLQEYASVSYPLVSGTSIKADYLAVRSGCVLEQCLELPHSNASSSMGLQSAHFCHTNLGGLYLGDASEQPI